MSPQAPVRSLRGFRNDVAGVGAIEFAVILPVMITIFVGGYELSQGVAAYRKVSATTRTVADLVTQSAASGLSNSDMTAILNASTQVMAPYPITDLKIVVTQFRAGASPTSPASVSWSETLNGQKVTASQTLPTGVVQPLGYVVRADVSYKFTPTIGQTITGPISMSDSLYMVPRQVASIIYPKQ